MAWDDQSSYNTDGAHVSLGDHRLKGLKSLSGFSDGGQANSIDITPLGGDSMQFAKGKKGAPSISGVANATFQSPLYAEIRQLNNGRGSALLTVVLGELPEDGGFTDGSPKRLANKAFPTTSLDDQGFKAIPASFNSANGKLTTDNWGLILKKDVAATLPGVSVGDYIQTTVAGPSGTAAGVKITRIQEARVGTIDYVVFQTDTTGSGTDVTTGRYKLYQPAVKMARQVLVMDYNFPLEPDAVATLNIEMQATGGAITTVVGGTAVGREQDENGAWADMTVAAGVALPDVD